MPNSWFFLLVLFVAVAAAPISHAGEKWRSEYDSISEVSDAPYRIGRVYRVAVKDLKPTQFAIGKAEIRQRVRDIAEMDKQELRQYLKRKIGTVVIGPKEEFYLVDGHHLASALTLSDEPEMLVKVVGDWSALSREEFFERMVRQKKMWLYDENGKGPLSPKSLPTRIHDMRDDPFRSFAYKIRKLKGFLDRTVPFQEFMWAGYFREHFTLAKVKNPSEATLRAGLLLAHAKEASALPGYTRGVAQCQALLRGESLSGE